MSRNDDGKAVDESGVIKAVITIQVKQVCIIPARTLPLLS